MIPSQIAIKRAQQFLVVGVVVVTLAVNSLILFSGTVESKNFYGNALRPMLAAVATALAVIVVIRQKTTGLFGKSYAFLAIGLALYLVAEILWAYYSIGLGIEVPFPSLADAFWLAAYGPFGYGLFILSKMYSRHSKKTVIIVSIITAALSLCYVLQLVAVSDLSGPDSNIALGISVSYPILDAIIIVPALLAVLSAGKGYLTSIPWIFISWIFTVIADTIFGFTAVMDIAGDVSLWNLFYNAAYVSMAAGMFWHNRYLIFDNKHMRKS